MVEFLLAVTTQFKSKHQKFVQISKTFYVLVYIITLNIYIIVEAWEFGC